jgi:hypothetical protein
MNTIEENAATKLKLEIKSGNNNKSINSYVNIISNFILNSNFKEKCIIELKALGK